MLKNDENSCWGSRADVGVWNTWYNNNVGQIQKYKLCVAFSSSSLIASTYIFAKSSGKKSENITKKTANHNGHYYAFSKMLPFHFDGFED